MQHTYILSKDAETLLRLPERIKDQIKREATNPDLPVTEAPVTEVPVLEPVIQKTLMSRVWEKVRIGYEYAKTSGIEL